MTNIVLRQALNDARITMRELASKAGVDVKTVERWVQEGRTPQPRHRRVAADVLGVDEAVLWPDSIRAAVKTGHDRERDVPLRQGQERLVTRSHSALSDRELLALLIGAGCPPDGAHAMAERMLARFGSVTALARADLVDLTVAAGLGQVKAARLVAGFELARRAAADAERPPTKISSAQDVAAVVGPLLHGRTRERVVVVICGQSGRVLGHEVLSEGAADRALLPVRETVAAVLRRDGKRFALAHNHPSGDPTPSIDDRTATLRIMQAAEATGLGFLGHIVVTDNSWQRVVTGPGRL